MLTHRSNFSSAISAGSAFIVVAAVALLAAAPPAKIIAGTGTLFVGGWPNKIFVIDEATEKITGTIDIATGDPTRMVLSRDKKRFYVVNSLSEQVEIIDIASRKSIDHFSLSEGRKKVFIRSMIPDPLHRFLVMLTKTAEKKIDRFEQDKTTKFAVVDLAQKKIVRTADVPKDEEPPGFGFGGGMRLSPDGKYLYVFRNNVLIFDTTDFKLVEKIELSKPQFPGIANVGIGMPLDSIQEPGMLISVFNSTDPVVRRNVFGIARFDLTRRTFEFTPVGPSTTGMMGLHVTPDH